MDMREDVDKIEIILSKEIHIYKLLLEYEEKKIQAILDNKIHDIEILCNFQSGEIAKADELRVMREKYIDKISQQHFSHLIDSMTLLDVMRRLSPEKSKKLSFLRVELITLMAKIRHYNKIIPKLLEEGIEVYSKMKDILAETRKIGYNSKGTEYNINKRLGTLINKQV